MAVDVLSPAARRARLALVTPKVARVPAPARPQAAEPATPWREGLPTLVGTGLVLRELRVEDAPNLAGLLTAENVAKFLAPPPRTASGVRRFVRWTHRKRAEGRYLCFGIVPAGSEHAVGFFQIRSTDGGFETAEWGFVLGRPYWGSGLFVEGAHLLLRFAFDTLGVRRLEARAVAENGRANGALRKLGAVEEGVLREAITIEGREYDMTMWSILGRDWQARTGKSRAFARLRSGPGPRRVK
ncbi:MAG: GNAT family protein [Vicinamibacterales bacterium]